MNLQEIRAALPEKFPGIAIAERVIAVEDFDGQMKVVTDDFGTPCVLIAYVIKGKNCHIFLCAASDLPLSLPSPYLPDVARLV